MQNIKALRIGVITIHNSSNYGACLQSFALYKYLNQLGYDVEIIDLHRPSHSDYITSRRFKPYTNRFESPLKICYKKLKKIFLRIVFYKQPKSTVKKQTLPLDVLQKFESFNAQIKLSRPYTSIEALYNDVPQYDVYITGSDQVWNPTQNYCIEPYFLSFAQKNKRISYGSSIGITELTPKEKRDFSHWLKQYHAISVREQSAQILLSSLVSTPIEQVVDPTFLLDCSYWKTIATKPTYTDYILIFTLDYNPYIVEYGLKLAKESGKNIISLNPIQPNDNRLITIKDAGPEEWLGYIGNADLVITDSYHCTVFSIILQAKNFATYIASWNKRGSRITDFLKRIGLQNHILESDLNQSYTYLSSQKIDYTKVSEIIETDKNRSIAFLLSNI